MLLSALVVSFAAAARPPSFVVLLGDDIGWADFSYNGGTAKTEKIDAWAASPGSRPPRGTRPLVKNDETSTFTYHTGPSRSKTATAAARSVLPRARRF